MRWGLVDRLEFPRPPSAAVAVEWVSAEDVVVSATMDDELVGAVLWRNYPRPEGCGAWTPVVAVETGSEQEPAGRRTT